MDYKVEIYYDEKFMETMRNHFKKHLDKLDLFDINMLNFLKSDYFKDFSLNFKQFKDLYYKNFGNFYIENENFLISKSIENLLGLNRLHISQTTYVDFFGFYLNYDKAFCSIYCVFYLSNNQIKLYIPKKGNTVNYSNPFKPGLVLNNKNSFFNCSEIMEDLYSFFSDKYLENNFEDDLTELFEFLKIMSDEKTIKAIDNFIDKYNL